MSAIWENCIKNLKSELSPNEFNTWILPLHAVEEDNKICLLAPNKFILDLFNEHCFAKVRAMINGNQNKQIALAIKVGNKKNTSASNAEQKATHNIELKTNHSKEKPTKKIVSNINSDLNFKNFVEGQSNRLAKAAAVQFAEDPAASYNPLFIYGSVGLGKTHLMHAIGTAILEKNPHKKIFYIHAERFVLDMINAMQNKKMEQFKKQYRSFNVLLIDDIQFFANKEKSQEELFLTFNTLLESKQQVVLSCDCYPTEVDGLQKRLQSRFCWGLTVEITPPELETRVAIVHEKARQAKKTLSDDVSFFIAERFDSNIRELEGAVNNIVAEANFTGKPITLDFAQHALRSLLISQDKKISIENIQKITAEYYKIRRADLLSKRRNRSITRPRQMAMTIAKDLTNHSLPEIGDAFGGRDHTTVLHACKVINNLRKTEQIIEEDYIKLTNTLKY